MVGANPLVSHGSVMTAPRVKDQLHAIVERGGRVVVVDPRRSETARAFEHVAVDPDSDAWLLLSMLEVIFAEGLEDAAAIARQTTGIEQLRELCAEHPPEATEARTGVARRARSAPSPATSPAPSAPRSTGAPARCLGRNGTLVAFLLDALNVVTGNLDREGGAMFGDPPIDFSRLADLVGLGTYAKVRSRIGDLPEVLGSLPASVMAKEMTTPGKGQIRAMFFSAGNPVLSVPERRRARGRDRAGSSSRSRSTSTSPTPRATATTCSRRRRCYEREDFPLPFLALFTTPFIQMTEAVVEPRGEARQEWEVIEEIASGSGSSRRASWPLRQLGRVGVKLSPRRLRRPAAAQRAEGRPLRPASRRAQRREARARTRTGSCSPSTSPPDVLPRPDPPHGQARPPRRRRDRAEVERLMALATAHDPEFPLRLIGLRELRSHNSWMHNAPLLMRGGREHCGPRPPRRRRGARRSTTASACRISSAARRDRARR